MLFGKEKKRSNFVMISYRIHLLRWVRHVTTYESTLMKLIQLSRLSQIQNGFAGPKALVGDACLFMQCKIFSKFPDRTKFYQTCPSVLRTAESLQPRWCHRGKKCLHLVLNLLARLSLSSVG